jgi:predicted RNA binding protein YcfA (HicA-like mRNA interferase family)
MKVKDIIRLLEDEGWFLVATRGSHRQFKHPARPELLQWPASRPTILHRER